MKKKCKAGYYYCYTDKKCKPIPRGFKVVGPAGMLRKENGHTQDDDSETKNGKKNGNGHSSNGNGNGSNGSGSNGNGSSMSEDHMKDAPSIKDAKPKKKTNVKYYKGLGYAPTIKEKTKKINEGWSDKYKKSIDCKNPKGFSQRAHCQGKKKTFKEFMGDI